MTRESEGAPWTARIVLAFFAAAMIGGGIVVLRSGRHLERENWGTVLFLGLVIAIGLLLLAALIVRWRTIGRPERPRRLKGKAARLARKAEQTTFPIDDYKKW